MATATIKHAGTLFSPIGDHSTRTAIKAIVQDVVPPVIHAGSKVKDFFGGKAFENTSVITATAAQAIEAIDTTGDAVPVNTLPETGHSIISPDGFLVVARAIGCAFIAANAFELSHELSKTKKELSSERVKIADPKSLQSMLIDQKVKALGKRIAFLADEFKMTMINLCNTAIQGLSSLGVLIANFISPAAATGTTIGSTWVVGKALAWAGVVGATIGFSLGVFFLVRNIHQMVKNRQEKKELENKLADLKELQKKNPHELLKYEIERLNFELQRNGNEWSHLKLSLLSNATMVLGCALSIALNITSGGIFEIVSWAIVGVILISGISSAVHKIQLNHELRRAEESLKQLIFPNLPQNISHMKPLSEAHLKYFGKELGVETSEKNLKVLALHRVRTVFATNNPRLEPIFVDPALCGPVYSPFANKA